MISRIYVMPKKATTRADSYLIDSKLSYEELTKLAQALTNSILETYFINHLEVLPPSGKKTSKFNYATEIGFLPGVTDNVGHTVKEIAIDLLHPKKSNNFAVYTSKIFFVSGTKEHAQKIALTLYNPLIERAKIVPVKNKKIHLKAEIPKVVLKKRKPVINVDLEVSEEELIKIGKEGILDNGKEQKRRGPL